MNLFFSILISLLCFHAMGQSPIKLSDIQGDWSCYDTGCQKMCESCCEEEIYLNLRIKGDSISFFHYPNMYYGTYKIQMKDSSLFCDSTLGAMLGKSYSRNKSYSLRSGIDHYPFAPTYCKNDTLVSAGYYFFKRKKFNDSIVDILKKDSLIVSDLKGKWKLVTMYDTYYDGEGMQPIQFPFKLSKQLNFTEKSLNPPRRVNKVVYIKADGVLRDFYIDYLSPGFLVLVAGKWNEEGFEVKYEKVE